MRTLPRSPAGIFPPAARRAAPSAAPRTRPCSCGRCAWAPRRPAHEVEAAGVVQIHPADLDRHGRAALPAGRKNVGSHRRLGKRRRAAGQQDRRKKDLTHRTHSSHQFGDRAAVVDDFHRPAFGRVELVVRVDAQAVVDRGGEILGAGGVAGRPLAVLVRLADDPSAANAAAGQKERVGRAPVVAAGVRS